MSKIIEVEKCLKRNNGYITTNELINIGITKPYINKLISNGIIEKVCHGIYANSKIIVDEYYVLQMKYNNIVYSHNTALYFLNLTNRAPMEIDITTPRDKRVRGNYNIHRVSNKIYNIGIIEVIDTYGNPIKIYNAERCICDILRSEILDIELRNRVLDYYFKSKNKDIDRLLEYAKIFKIYDKVNTIMGVMLKW